MPVRPLQGKRLAIGEAAGLLALELEPYLERRGMELSGSAPCGRPLQALVRAAKPDVVLLKLEAGGAAALDAGCRLREDYPDCAQLFASPREAAIHAASAMSAIVRRFGAASVLEIPATCAAIGLALEAALAAVGCDAATYRPGEVLLLDHPTAAACAGCYVYLGQVDAQAWIAPAEIGPGGGIAPTERRVLIPLRDLRLFYRTEMAAMP